MTTLVVIVFVAVYLGMLLGGIPGLRVDRTGAALLGAIVLLATGGISEPDALESIDVPTLALLFGLMVVSAQFQLGGFYGMVTRRVVSLDISPAALLAVVIALSGVLSAVLTNDVVCLAVAPLLLRLCVDKRLNPVPYLLALACSANVGSAATLIGNPQNILVGESLNMSFNGYLLTALPPSVLGLAVVWAVIVLLYRGRWRGETDAATTDDAVAFDRWQTAKGLIVVALLIAGFVLTPWPRELLALSAAGVLMLSRTFRSRKIMGLVDWPLIMLFIALFIVNKAFELTGGMEWVVSRTESSGVSLQEPLPLFIATAVLSNLVSNVPAVMLLLPIAQGHDVGAILALASTLSGNLIIVGSIANIVVVEAARRGGVKIDLWTHARVGVPVTVVTLLIAGAWLWLVT